nr:porin [Caballeronia udeis]
MESCAYAQSSVTLYGLIDVGVNYINNVRGHYNIALTSGVVQGSRWGLKGREDLGGGLSAIFTLENGFDVTNGTLGQGGALFGRQAYAGFSSERFGTITLGRQYDLLTDFIAPLSILTETGIGAPLDNDNTDHTIRLNNTVKYTSADYGGLKFSGLYAFSNSPSSDAAGTGFAANRAWNFGAAYMHGPINLAVAYSSMNGLGANSTGAITNAPVNAPVLKTVTSQKIFAAAGGYTFGPATVNLVYSHVKFKGSTQNFINNGEDVNNYQINGVYHVTPATVLSAGYYYTDIVQNVGNIKPKFQILQLMADYFLSKRTDVYVLGAYQRANSDAGPASFAPYPLDSGVSGTGNQVLVRVGMRLKF